MKIQELIDRLQEIADNEYYAKAEVLAAIQPRWPLAVSIDAVTADQGEKYPVVWIAVTAHAPYDISPYAPRAAWDGEEIINKESE